LEGVELYFNNELKGDVSDMDFQKEETAKRSVYKIIEGKKIVLTIDKFIQHIVEKEIQKSYELLRPESISAIVMDPRNGDILAMANMPDFDPNNVRLFSQGTLKNLCVSDYYEPGSIFKIISVGAMLNDDDFPLDKGYLCEGSIKIGNKRIKCWSSHKYIKYSDALKYSCNAAIINKALNLDPKYFYMFVRNLGFGSITGVELPGELKGLLRPAHQWALFSLGSISIGQEIGVTPLQLITAISAFANGGNLNHPHIVKEIRYADNTVYRKFDPMVIRNCVSPTVTSTVRDLLLKVTEKGGTGDKASIPKYRIAGKTGTSQVFDMKGNKYFKEKHVLSFIGYYPVERPEIVILVIVRSPKNLVDATGGVVVAPIFREIAMKINSYLDIIPVNNVINGDPQTQIPQKNRQNGKTGFFPDILPDLSGYNMKQCIILVNGLGLTPNFIGSGVAYKQYPVPGTKLNKQIPLTVWFK
jgi:cell division protein FtsI/penicillin-binding protein 2